MTCGAISLFVLGSISLQMYSGVLDTTPAASKRAECPCQAPMPGWTDGGMVVINGFIDLRRKTMTIGTGIVLFVIGAILVFALDIRLDWIDLDIVGYILMGAGAIAFVIGLILLASRRGRRPVLTDDDVI